MSNLNLVIEEMRNHAEFSTLFQEPKNAEQRTRNGAIVRAIAAQRSAMVERRSLRASEQRTLDAAVASVRAIDAAAPPTLSPAVLLAFIAGEI